MTKVTKSISQQIKDEAIKSYPKEACGFVILVGKKMVLKVCANISSTPQTNFVISPDDFADAEDQGSIVSIWHTHVDEPSTPSQTDIHSCNISGVDWLILDIYKKDEQFEFGEFCHLTPSGEQIGYLSRPYIFGVYDCFTLVVDYYRKEFGINVSFRATGYPEIQDWEEKGLNILVDNFALAGFEKLTHQEVKVGDLFLIQMGSDIPNHIAIYIGEDQILHHCQNRLSARDYYGGGYWQKHTAVHLRHQSRI